MTGERDPSLQERYAPESICFGCGPANRDGLHVRSFAVDGTEDVVAEWMPGEPHQAFPGVLNGGVIGTLLDCHSNWTAALHLMRARGTARPPTTVTADYTISLKRPTPSDRPVRLWARVVEATADRAVVEAMLESDGGVCATCRGTFVAVKEGHPAFERW